MQNINIYKNNWVEIWDSNKLVEDVINLMKTLNRKIYTVLIN